MAALQETSTAFLGALQGKTATKTDRSTPEATVTFTPTVLSTDSGKSPDLGTELSLHSERPGKDRRRITSNPFDSTWTLVEEYVERYCSLPEFTSCPLLDTLWECCHAVCEVKYGSGRTNREFMENKWGELMTPLNELCSVLYPRNRDVSRTHYRPDAALSPASDIPLEALRLAVAQLVKNTPLTISGIEFDDVWNRIQLAEQLWKLRGLEALPGNCGSSPMRECKGRKFPTRHEAILDAIWHLLKTASSAIEAHHDEAVVVNCGALGREAHFRVRRRREKEAFEACWRACEVLKTVVADSIWCNSEKVEDNEIYLGIYSPRVPDRSAKPTSTEPDLPSSEDPHGRGMCKKVNEWNQDVITAEKELDLADVVDHSDDESTQASSDASGEKASLDCILPAEAQEMGINFCAVGAGATIPPASDVAPSKVMPSSPESWDELTSPPIKEGPVGPQSKEIRGYDPWQAKEKVSECDPTIKEKAPQMIHNQATASTQAPPDPPVNTLQTHTAQANERSASPNTHAQAPSNQAEKRPSNLPPKPPPPATATAVPTPPSGSVPTPPSGSAPTPSSGFAPIPSSGSAPTPSSGSAPPLKKAPACTRCSTLDLADIEAVHHIRLRILLLHAATARGYSSTSGRKFADFVREMPATSFGETKAQKKLFNTYRRAVLYSTDNIKGKGDTVAHEANVMQVKAAVDWKTQGGKYMFLRELYKHVVGVEVEKMDSLPEKSKATIMTG